jgi:hypothetical protein
LVNIEVSDEKGNKRKGEILAFEIKGQKIPLLGNVALAKLE